MAGALWNAERKRPFTSRCLQILSVNQKTKPSDENEEAEKTWRRGKGRYHEHRAC